MSAKTTTRTPRSRAGRVGRLAARVVALGAGLGIVALALVLVLPQAGVPMPSVVRRPVSALEAWLGGRLLALANGVLRPELAFAELRYVAPATIVLEGVTLTDGDVSVITVDEMHLTLSELPRAGQPFVIRTARLVRPVVRLIERADGGLAGFTNMVDAGAGNDGGSDVTADARGSISDAFAIRRLELEDGVVEVVAGDGTTMRLDGLTFALTGAPTTDPGWYGFEMDLARDPLFRLAMDARFDLDDPTLDIATCRLAAGFGVEQRRTLPPAFQRHLAEHEVEGNLTLDVAGVVAFARPLGGTLRGDLAARDVVYRAGDVWIRAATVDLAARLQDRLIAVDGLRVVAERGMVAASGTFEPDAEWQTGLDVRLSDVRLEDLLRGPDGAEPALAGRLDVDGHVTARLDRFDETFLAEGTIDLAEGRVFDLPVVGDVVRAAQGDLLHHSKTDRGTSAFAVTTRDVRFRGTTLVSASTATRGEGEITFPRTIDFRVNAGPLERVQSALGPIGDLFGAITDRIVTYHVTGTLDRPVVTARPFGLGTK